MFRFSVYLERKNGSGRMSRTRRPVDKELQRLAILGRSWGHVEARLFSCCDYRTG